MFNYYKQFLLKRNFIRRVAFIMTSFIIILFIILLNTTLITTYLVIQSLTYDLKVRKTSKSQVLLRINLTRHILLTSEFN